MKRAIITAFVLFAAASAAAAATPNRGAQQAQGTAGRLRLETLERLAPKAVEAVNIDIDGILINFAGSLLSEDDADERTVKEIIQGLKGVYVRSYEFKTEGQFADADLTAVREQLRAPGWTRVIDVKSLGVELENDEVYVATAGGRVEGLAILDVQPKEVTVINLVGAIDLDKLKKLQGTIHLPRVHPRRKRSDE